LFWLLDVYDQWKCKTCNSWVHLLALAHPVTFYDWQSEVLRERKKTQISCSLALTGYKTLLRWSVESVSERAMRERKRECDWESELRKRKRECEWERELRKRKRECEWEGEIEREREKWTGRGRVLYVCVCVCVCLYVCT